MVSKIEMLTKNRNADQKEKFEPQIEIRYEPKIKILTKKPNFGQK